MTDSKLCFSGGFESLVRKDSGNFEKKVLKTVEIDRVS